MSDEWEGIFGDDIRLKRLKVGTGQGSSYEALVAFSVKTSVRLEGGDDFSLVETEEDMVAKIGSSDVPPAIELSLKMAREGDILLVRSHPKFCSSVVVHAGLSAAVEVGIPRLDCYPHPSHT